MESTTEILRQYGWVGMAAMFILKELFAMIRGDRKQMSETLRKVEIATTELKIHVSYLKETNSRMSKVQRDIENAFVEIRKMKAPAKLDHRN